jgi:hypothetical protein
MSKSAVAELDVVHVRCTVQCLAADRYAAGSADGRKAGLQFTFQCGNYPAAAGKTAAATAAFPPANSLYYPAFNPHTANIRATIQHSWSSYENTCSYCLRSG